MTRRHSSSERQHICTCPCCSPYGPGNGKATYFASRGRHTTASTFACGSPLKAALEATPKRSTIILTTADGKPWTADGFRASWRKACARAGVVGVTFNDLRGSAVTRLALVECTEAEIATITGHALRDVRSILDANYLHRDPALGESAIRKLEKGTKSSNRVSNRSTCSDGET
jgi:integrase